jgi:hypothetical protein
MLLSLCQCNLLGKCLEEVRGYLRQCREQAVSDLKNIAHHRRNISIEHLKSFIAKCFISIFIYHFEENEDEF